MKIRSAVVPVEPVFAPIEITFTITSPAEMLLMLAHFNISNAEIMRSVQQHTSEKGRDAVRALLNRRVTDQNWEALLEIAQNANVNIDPS